MAEAGSNAEGPYQIMSMKEAFYFDDETLSSRSLVSLFQRYRAEERYKALVNMRLSQYCYSQISQPYEAGSAGRLTRFVRSRFARVRFLFYKKFFLYARRNNYRTCGCDISPLARIGKNFWGIFRNVAITAYTVIGRNVYIEANVTIADHKGQYPIVGNNVRIRTGAVIMGGVRIGDDAVIGANSVVTSSVPANTTVIGVPARPVFRTR